MAVDRTLTTLAKVKAILEEESTSYDEIITTWIGSATELIYKASGHREFVPMDAGPVERVFDFGGAFNPVTNEFNLRCDLKDVPASVVITDDIGTVMRELTEADYTLLPRIREPWQPFRRIRFSWRTVRLTSPLWLLKVTASWGFPAVPADIDDACAKQVALWIGKNLAQFSTTFALDENHIVKPRALDAAIRDVAESYKLNTL